MQALASYSAMGSVAQGLGAVELLHHRGTEHLKLRSYLDLTSTRGIGADVWHPTAEVAKVAWPWTNLLCNETSWQGRTSHQVVGKFIEQNNTRGPELRFRVPMALSAIPVWHSSFMVAAGIGVVRASHAVNFTKYKRSLGTAWA